MYKKILMAFNASRDGRSALLESAEIAAFIKAETHLLAVAGMPPSLFMSGYLPEDVLKERKKRTQEILDEGIKLLQDQGFNTTGHLTVGEPVEEICRVAAELDADLIVLGHRQRLSFAARWWKSSVGASLVDIAPCSILIARAAAGTLRR